MLTNALTLRKIPTPQATSCCICSRTILGFEPIVEQRPTGEEMRLEDWHYCPNCWSRMVDLRKSDPFVKIPPIDWSGEGYI